MAYLNVLIVSVQFIYRFILLCFDKTLGLVSLMILVVAAFIIYGLNSFRRYTEFVQQHNFTHDFTAISIGWINNDTGKVLDYGIFSSNSNNTASYVILFVGYSIILFCTIAVFIRLRWSVILVAIFLCKLYIFSQFSFFHKIGVNFVISLEWGAIKHNFLLILCPINNIVNIFLLYLIYYHTSKALSSYKKILYLGTIFDLYSNNAAALSGMVIMMKYGYQFVLIQGIFGPLPEPFSGLAYLLYHCSQYIILTIVVLQFIYRFYLICFNKELGWISFLLLVGISFICCRANSYRRFSEFIQKHENSHDEMVKSFGWINKNTGNVYDYVVFATTINNLPSYIIMFVSYSFIVLCALAVHIRIRIGVSSLHSFNSTIYRETTIVLCLEVITPFFAVIVPSSVYFLSVAFNMSITWLDSVLTIMSFSDPLINALIKITVIRCYRITVLKWFRQTFPKKIQMSINLNGS